MITIDPPSRPNADISTPAKQPLTRFLSRASKAIGLQGPVSVLLTSDRAMRALNRDFRGKDRATDVLSFPAPAEMSALTAGDLAISLDTAARQAEQHRHTLAVELRILLLHGLLHLSGLDHESDAGEMAAREAALRSRFRLPNTLIARSSQPRGRAPSAAGRESAAGRA